MVFTGKKQTLYQVLSLMIYVGQGHERSISLEIFLKSFLMLSRKEREQFILVVDRNVFESQIKHLKLNSVLLSLQCIFIEGQEPLSTLSLQKCLEVTTAKDILITLPTSKDQLLLKGRPPQAIQISFDTISRTIPLR